MLTEGIFKLLDKFGRLLMVIMVFFIVTFFFDQAGSTKLLGLSKWNWGSYAKTGITLVIIGTSLVLLFSTKRIK